MRQARRQAGRVPPRRTGRRHQSGHAPLLDPTRYRIVLFDQRGCGRSTPHAELERQHHLAPRRRHRAAARASRHRALAGVRRLVGQRPSRSRTPRRIPSGSPSWCCAASSRCGGRSSTGSTRRGAADLPRPWEDFIAPIPDAERGDLIERLPPPPDRRRPDGAVEAARAWSAWEGKTYHRCSEPSRVRRFSEDDYAARLRPHRVPLLRQRRLLRCRASADQGRVPHPPHPRRDRAWPLRRGAHRSDRWDLHRAWPEAELRIVADAGHAMTETGIVHELVAATERLRRLTSKDQA